MALPKKDESSAPKKASKKESQAHQGNTASRIITRLNDLNTRMRLVEERMNQNKARLRVLDDQMLGIKKHLSEDMSELSDDITSLRKSIKNIDDTIKRIIKELELTAKKQELNVIEKYVDMMDPTRYVTKEELKGMLKKNG